MSKITKSPDGDLIDCVLSHRQPAFDHPQLKGQKPLEPPDRPKGHNPTGMVTENFQLWSMSACSWVCDWRQYYGAKASINVWAPTVSNHMNSACHKCGSFLVHLGMILTPLKLVGRLAQNCMGTTTPDSLHIGRLMHIKQQDATICYAQLCSTNNRIAIGAAISPTSSYNGGQFDISLLVWKDPKHGNWWLEFGNGVLVGYWPSFLFTHLTDHASMIQFGGEIVNSRPSGFHTSTQMGSGHFAGEGFGKASYFRNLQVVDWDNNLIPLTNLKVLADHPNCYDIQGGINRVWGNYFYYGGPGRNVRCP
ncbi:hypothetical protein GH714_028426 [Hevea brasiliensis]|uniref:Neprosin PEP catalytic domain-containing protein n=1 Tax=Hevea brasiliensis TaxID=3981 RepID=A0A6A6LJN7_HEVBR|nr:hypothetical protein GH714_028426 [Hevea brasiliensis]